MTNVVIVVLHVPSVSLLPSVLPVYLRPIKLSKVFIMLVLIVKIVPITVLHVQLQQSVLNVSLNTILRLINLVVLAQLTVLLVLLKWSTELKRVSVQYVIPEKL